MWKSTSLASVSQLRTKRSDGVVVERGRRRAQAAARSRRAALGLGAHPGGGEQAEVLAQDALDAAEAAVGVALLDARARAPRRPRAGWPAREQREARAGGGSRVIGALLDGLAVGVDRERQRRAPPQPLEALAGEAAQVGARREEIDDRAVGAGGRGAMSPAASSASPSATSASTSPGVVGAPGAAPARERRRGLAGGRAASITSAKRPVYGAAGRPLGSARDRPRGASAAGARRRRAAASPPRRAGAARVRRRAPAEPAPERGRLAATAARSGRLRRARSPAGAVPRRAVGRLSARTTPPGAPSRRAVDDAAASTRRRSAPPATLGLAFFVAAISRPCGPRRPRSSRLRFRRLRRRRRRRASGARGPASARRCSTSTPPAPTVRMSASARAVDAEARVVLLGLEHQQRGERATARGASLESSTICCVERVGAGPRPSASASRAGRAGARCGACTQARSSSGRSAARELAASADGAAADA